MPMESITNTNFQFQDRQTDTPANIVSTTAMCNCAWLNTGK